MGKHKGWPKGISSFCSVCKSEAADVPYIKLYADEFPEKYGRITATHCSRIRIAKNLRFI